MINSRSVLQLTLDTQALINAWLGECAKVGLEILIVSTYRDNAYQNFLYASGRTRQGKIVTNAKGGESAHNARRAVDFCVMDGKICDWANIGAFTQAGLIAEKLGLEWGGRYKIADFGHIELPAKGLQQKINKGV